jgi:hypothetical protein
MVSDQQVRRLLSLMEKETYFYQAVDKAGMSEKTARKYKQIEKLPSQVKGVHNWRTRTDPFERDWADIVEMLMVHAGFESKTLFEHLQRKHPGRYQDGQLRTLQRRINHWRATEGPAKEVYFSQIHHPGDLCASDFTHMNSLGVTIQGELFEHLLYHFVLTYSNWEAFTISYSESFASLSAGIQNALWKLGYVPDRHRSDRMTAAVNKECNPEVFTRRYQALIRHYNLKPEKTNVRSANENGDVESSHKGLKSVVKQALMLRGSKDFRTIEEYESFLQKIVNQRNMGRKQRLKEELHVMKPLPAIRFDDFKTVEVRVGSGSSINVEQNVYSVHSRLKGEKVRVRIYAETIEVWYAQKTVACMPRLRGKGKHRINYRHIIDWLVRKPGAFANYRYKNDLFPSSWFRMAYDWLKSNMPLQADKEYVRILALAAWESESNTEHAIGYALEHNRPVTVATLTPLVIEKQRIPEVTDITIAPTNLAAYDELLEEVSCYV